MDVVYILGKGSKWQDNEIRYSLRSVSKYLKDYNKIYIIGECPDFIDNVVHIPFKEDAMLFKERRIAEKVIRACEEKSISEDFLFFNDDFFLTAPVSAINYPFFCNGTLYDSIKNRKPDSYKTSLENTHNALISLRLSSYYFDIHTPIIYNKTKFKAAIQAYNWNVQYGYVVKSLYANTMLISQGIEPVIWKDCKINNQVTEEEIKAIIQCRHIFSIGNNVLLKNDSMKNFLSERYPDKCMYEK